MVSWWQQPYPGGQPVQVDGFPRCLYPPSAKNRGKQPTSDGPDVLAIKRAISRLGRWPWQEFDDHFSDRFSLGNPSSDVSNSGVAGFQRQQHIDDTGWWGKKSFTNLLYARIPKPLPNSGAPALDAKAIELLNEAYVLYGGHDQGVEENTVRQRALDALTNEIGYTEFPPGSNNNFFGEWYGLNFQPWCAMAVTWAFEVGGGGSPSFQKGQRYSYVPYVVSDAQERLNGLSVTQDPIPGDLVCYDWQGDTIFDHIGIFEGWVTLLAFHAIEGNTSTSSDSNGGEVMRRTRDTGEQRTVFVRVAEP